MRLSGLQNPQAARAGSPGKHSATGEHSRVAADALPGLQNPQAARAGSPGKHSATGEHSRVAADALPGLRNCPAYTFTAAIEPLSRRQRVYAKSAVEWRPVA